MYLLKNILFLRRCIKNILIYLSDIKSLYYKEFVYNVSFEYYYIIIYHRIIELWKMLDKKNVKT